MRQQSPVLRFKTAAQMRETFGMQKGGKEYRRLIQAFERIFGATIFFGTHEERPTARVIVTEYDEMGKTDDYWKRIAERDRQRLGTLQAMLGWASSTSDPQLVDDIQTVRSTLT